MRKISKSRIQLILATAIALLASVFFMRWALADKNTMQNRVEKILLSVKETKNTDPLDLQTLTNKRITHLCVQSPYMPKSSFEKFSGVKVQNFSGVDDQFYVLWIFFADGLTEQIKIDRWKQMDISENSKPCTKQSSKVFFENTNNTIHFLISGE